MSRMVSPLLNPNSLSLDDLKSNSATALRVKYGLVGAIDTGRTCACSCFPFFRLDGCEFSYKPREGWGGGG